QNPSYLISVSEVLHCGVPTPLSVTILADYPIKVTAELIHGNSSVAQAESTIPVFSNDTSYWYPYQLDVKGFVGTNQVFSNSTTMVFSPKCMSVFIQTDKNNYQPGQTVKFRVVLVTPEGNPHKGQIDIFIKDPKGNLIRQWLSVDGFLGVVSKELNLSQNPPLGPWKIVESYFFEVLAYYSNYAGKINYQDRAEPADSVSLSVSVSEPGSLLGILVVDKAALDSISNEVGISIFSPKNDLSFYRRLFYVNNLLICVCSYLCCSNSALDSFQFTVPDSLTSWVAFAIVMSENLGLGISAPAELTVFQDFFVSLNLPAFLIRGELLLLEVNLFNYMDVDMEVMVVVAESWMFEFVSPDNGGFSLDNVRKVLVSSQNIASLLFPIRATALGEIPISVKATSVYSSDWVYKTVLVKPEGLEQSYSQALFLEFQLKQNMLTRTMSFSFPANVVPDSQRASVSAVGDILGPSIGNLDSLIEMPYGCGEQNMIHFAPNIYVLQYMRSTKQTDEQTRNKAMSYMMEAYERELSYQRLDGSFSAFGDSDGSGSTWLSAFVLRCFLQAQDFISIDPMVMQRIAYWLLAHQNADGSFAEPGRVIHTELQGGLDGPVSLTAYVLIALLEDAEYRVSSISSAVSFLTSRLAQRISSNYSLSLVTYALSLANSTAAPSALTELLNRALIVANVLYNSWQPSSSDIEMSAYVLLAMHRLKLMDEGFTLVKWLNILYHQYCIRFWISRANHEFQPFLIVQILFGATVDILWNHLLREDQGLRQTGMAILDVGLLSGFGLAQNGVQLNDIVRRVETPSGRITLYLDMVSSSYMFMTTILQYKCAESIFVLMMVYLVHVFVFIMHPWLTVCPISSSFLSSQVTTMERCVEISTILEFKVVNVQDAVVMIYDYYEPSKTLSSRFSNAFLCCSMCFKLLVSFPYLLQDGGQCGPTHLRQDGTCLCVRYVGRIAPSVGFETSGRLTGRRPLINIHFWL
uniref:CD109 molecule n=1 Tax=Sinocyclocheilus anshuiensis TaxID=1608454 RepID=A0A671LLX4_9TELE